MTAVAFFGAVSTGLVSGAIIFTAQLVLIAGLLVQRQRRRLAEEEILKSEKRYRSVVDTQTELICRFLPDTTLTFVNDAYRRFWNAPPAWFVSRRFIDFVPASHRDIVLDRLSRIGASGGHSGEAGPPSVREEHPVILCDGALGWQHWTYRPITDANGVTVEIQGIGRDITDRRRAEETADQLEARNTAILRVMPDLMFVLLPDGTYVDYHARDPLLLPAPPDRLIGSTIRDVMPAPAAELLMQALGRTRGSAEPVLVEYDVERGQLRHFEARFVSAEQGCVVCIVRDVTEARRAQALNRDLAGRLLASQEVERARIARELHDDVCQEVAATSVDLSHLRQRGGDVGSVEVQAALLGIERRTASVAEALRRLSHGLHPSVLQHIGLVPALQAHCAEVERQHHLRIRFFADCDLEPPSHEVAVSLFRIAQEALRNTVRHAQAHTASVTLRRDTRSLSLVVEDDGHGFDALAGRRHDGLGVLSIEERARLAGGRATIRSAPGEGTAIHVRIPLTCLDRTQPAKPSIRPARSVPAAFRSGSAE
jgi:PAS domain S-box-containing protein